ncbi:MAG: 4-hydroxythreonine-4-phosphate dehydrogenase PdxA [Bacteroidetes bacterium 4572_77]|nr:MAG: 4-hydroxythreonine-4-phosphate dehydrogenase PdxA [Bacteroidetes bacterium 4572_77]
MERRQNSDYIPLIGISHGDINGINYEIIIKALNDRRMSEMFNCVLYGSSKMVAYYQNSLDLPRISFNNIRRTDKAQLKKLNILNITQEEIKVETGKSTSHAGELAYLALERAVSDLSNNYLQALVTAPIDKSNIQSEKFNFAGHTGYLAEAFKTRDYLMLLVADSLRVGVVTAHIPIQEVSAAITKELILAKLKVLHRSLEYDFGIKKPRIAVLGLNPHASDNGLIGKEEEEVIIPAIEEAQRKNMLVFGPYAADGFFAARNYQNFDAILAMYHDQGLIPFKTLSFEEGVNFTAGLPVVRTSPAHGTAFDIAGKNIASESSMRQAIYLAADIIANRKEYHSVNRNPLKTKAQLDKIADEDISSLLAEDVDENEGLSI